MWFYCKDMAQRKSNKFLLHMQIFNFIVKASAISFDLHEVVKENVKGDRIVLQVISNVGFVMCSRKCAAVSSCQGVNFYKPGFKCELLYISSTVTTTLPAEDWWYADNMDWLKVEENQCPKMKRKVLLSSGTPYCLPIFPRNCQDLQILQQISSNGVYKISPHWNRTFDVYCDFDRSAGPWTVIQRRRYDDGVDFGRLWVDYKTGFGDLKDGFWLGNDNLHSLLSAGHYALRIYIEDYDGAKHLAQYTTFYVAGENKKYRLTVKGYSGTIVDAFKEHNNYMFSTKDSDNDAHFGGNCAQKYKTGWWFTDCSDCNMNSLQWDTVDRRKVWMMVAVIS